jgi:hypothetical protein
MAYTSSFLDREYQTISRREVVEIARRNLQLILEDSVTGEVYNQERNILNESLEQVKLFVKQEQDNVLELLENNSVFESIPDPSSPTFESDIQTILDGEGTLGNFINASFTAVDSASELILTILSKTGILPQDFKNTIDKPVAIAANVLLFLIPGTRTVALSLTALSFAKIIFEAFSQESAGNTIAEFLINF